MPCTVNAMVFMVVLSQNDVVRLMLDPLPVTVFMSQGAGIPDLQPWYFLSYRFFFMHVRRGDVKNVCSRRWAWRFWNVCR
jgi:hypothetical protein